MYPPWNVSSIHLVSTVTICVPLSFSLSLWEGFRKATKLSFDFGTEMPKRHEERRHANGRRGEKKSGGRGRKTEDRRELDRRKREIHREEEAGCSPCIFSYISDRLFTRQWFQLRPDKNYSNDLPRYKFYMGILLTLEALLVCLGVIYDTSINFPNFANLSHYSLIEHLSPFKLFFFLIK